MTGLTGATGAPGVTGVAKAGAVSKPARRSGRSPWAAPVMALGAVSLLAGLWAGLERLGLDVSAGQTDLATLHGVLMPLGFLGTLISVERAVALSQGWAWLTPAACGVGSLWLIAGLPGGTGQLLIAAAGFGMLSVFAELHRMQPSWHNAVQGAGAACWCAAGLLWMAGRGLPDLVPWLAGFLVLTICGERLELSRLAALTARGRTLFVLAGVVLLAGLGISVAEPAIGVRVAGAGFVGLSLWLATHDIVRRTIRMRGVTRYMAVALALGYVWLAVTGVLWVLYGMPSGGAAYDAMLHAVFLGFVISMVFAHAQVIVPAVLRVRFPYHPTVYVTLALLHGSLVLRLVVGDALGNNLVWQIAGVLNEVAVLMFLAQTAGTVIRARRRPAAVPRR